MTQRYWNEKIETMELAEMRKLQSERLVHQVKHMWDNVPYYRKKMEEKGLKFRFCEYRRKLVEI